VGNTVATVGALASTLPPSSSSSTESRESCSPALTPSTAIRSEPATSSRHARSRVTSMVVERRHTPRPSAPAVTQRRPSAQRVDSAAPAQASASPGGAQRSMSAMTSPCHSGRATS
jgi:hypothetical protein